jgi:hypothetical protein
MSNIPPNEGTWNIRLWRSREHPGKYSLEVQDPKSGVESSTYGMRFPEPEWAYEWFRAFAVPDESVSALSPGSYISGKGESSTWFPILHALHHATGPREGSYPVSMWFYGAYQPMQPDDPLAEETPKPEPKPEESRPLDPKDFNPDCIEVFTAHYVEDRTNVFGLQRFFHKNQGIEDFYFRFDQDWEDGLRSDGLWEDEIASCLDLIKYVPDEDGDGPDTLDLVYASKWVELNPVCAPIFVEIFDKVKNLPPFVAEWASWAPNDGLVMSQTDSEQKDFLTELHDHLWLIEEGFKPHPLMKEFLQFMEEDEPIVIINVLKLIAYVGAGSPW